MAGERISTADLGSGTGNGRGEARRRGGRRRNLQSNAGEYRQIKRHNKGYLRRKS